VNDIDDAHGMIVMPSAPAPAVGLRATAWITYSNVDLIHCPGTKSAMHVHALDLLQHAERRVIADIGWPSITT